MAKIAKTAKKRNPPSQPAGKTPDMRMKSPRKGAMPKGGKGPPGFGGKYK